MQASETFTRSFSRVEEFKARVKNSPACSRLQKKKMFRNKCDECGKTRCKSRYVNVSEITLCKKCYCKLKRDEETNGGSTAVASTSSSGEAGKLKFIYHLHISWQILLFFFNSLLCFPFVLNIEMLPEAVLPALHVPSSDNEFLKVTGRFRFIFHKTFHKNIFDTHFLESLINFWLSFKSLW